MTAHGYTPDRSYAYGGAVYFHSGSMTIKNSLFAGNTLSAQRTRTYRGSALYANTGDCLLVNSTLVENTTAPAIYNSAASVELINSIVFFNYNSGTQIEGSAVVSYSDIQGGFEGENVISYNPILDSEYRILPGSPAIDQGHPGLEYQDTLPPGLETERNDMGFLGGPDAHLWEDLNDLEGACCLPDGGCLHQTETQCINSEGGTFQGVGTYCGLVQCPLLNQPPVANAGSDQMVFDEISLNGTLSNDPDGTIVSYEWQIIHKSNSAYNRNAEGESPMVINLAPGFYDVTLTVTDDAGGAGTDNLFFSAIGLKGDLDLDNDVDGADLLKFSEYFGM